MIMRTILEAQPVNDPPPPPKISKGREGDTALYNLLISMKLNECVDMNRLAEQVKAAAYRLRKRDLAIKVIARPTKPGHCRVWRIA